MSEEKKCPLIHQIDGRTPESTDTHLEGRTCDCGKLIFFLEPCGCPGAKHDELKSQPNINYIPSV